MTVNIIKQYNMLDYDANMHQLYYELKELVNSRFSNQIEFDANERIVFIHQDQDFFITDDFPGFTLYNLQLILRELDIPNFFCAVVSNLPNYSKYTTLVRDILRPDDVPIRGISSLYNYIIYLDETVTNREVSPNDIRYPFISLNRLSRFPRSFFVAKLFQSSLQNKGLVSYHNIPSSVDDQKKLSASLLSPCTFLHTSPFGRCNHEIRLYQLDNRDLVKEFQKNVKNYVNFQEPTNVNDKVQSMVLQSSILSKALVYVGTETSVVHPMPYLSKISFKGIAHKRPFIIVGTPGILSCLRDLGFKTFSDFWDESYDLITDYETRVDCIIDLLTQISSYSEDQLQKLCHSMEEILNHNYQHLVGNFIDQEREKINNILDLQFL